MPVFRGKQDTKAITSIFKWEIEQIICPRDAARCCLTFASRERAAWHRGGAAGFLGSIHQHGRLADIGTIFNLPHEKVGDVCP